MGERAAVSIRELHVYFGRQGRADRRQSLERLFRDGTERPLPHLRRIDEEKSDAASVRTVEGVTIDYVRDDARSRIPRWIRRRSGLGAGRSGAL